MTNKVCVIPIGDAVAAQEIVTILGPDGNGMKLKNKYFEADLVFDFDYEHKAPAVMWIGFSHFCDMMPPTVGIFEDSEVRLLLRVCEGKEDSVPESLKDWEVENFAEVINVRLETFQEEVKDFFDGKGRSSLLDEEQGPAGARVIEALEMVSWPCKMEAGKPQIQQKIQQMVNMLSVDDPECNNFDQAMSIMMQLKEQIPKLPEDEKHKYAAEIALAFQKMLGAEIEEDENE